jgi:hypothetical protein
LWTVRCDGDTSRGQCERVYEYPSTVAGVVEMALLDDPAVGPQHISEIESAGWLTAGKGSQRHLCPRHVASVERMLLANLEGLPFHELSGGQS